jgi:hypothetical protein
MPDVPEALAHDDDALVIESVTWLDGSPVAQTRRLGAAWRERLVQPGVVALATGLALVCCFSLPWFSMLRSAFGNGPEAPEPESGYVSFSGWSISRGMPLAPNGATRIALFVHLWLVPVAAGVLLVIAWLCVRRRVSSRFASGALLALSMLALLVELGYVAQVSSLASVIVGSPGAPSPIGVAWGCWLAVAVSVVASAAGAYLLRPSHPLLTTAESRPSAAREG